MSKQKTYKNGSAQSSPKDGLATCFDLLNFRSSKLGAAVKGESEFSQGKEVGLDCVQAMVRNMRKRSEQITHLIQEQLLKLQSFNLSQHQLSMSLVRGARVLRLLDILYKLITKNIKVDLPDPKQFSHKPQLNCKCDGSQMQKQCQENNEDFQAKYNSDTMLEQSSIVCSKTLRFPPFEAEKADNRCKAYLVLPSTNGFLHRKEPSRFSSTLEFSLMLDGSEHALPQSKAATEHNQIELSQVQRATGINGKSSATDRACREFGRIIKNLAKISINSLNMCNYLLWKLTSPPCFEQVRKKIMQVSEIFNIEYKAGKGCVGVAFCERLKAEVNLIYEWLHRQYKRIFN